MKLVFLDIETNGLDFSKHVPLEIAILIVDKYGKHEDYYSTLIECSEEDWMQSDQKALELNGLRESDHILCKKINTVQNDIIRLFDKCFIHKNYANIICQNPSFDRIFFNKIVPCEIMNSFGYPYHWLDLASMFFIKSFSNPQFKFDEHVLSKDYIASIFSIPPELIPHSASRGVHHLYECYEAVRKW